MTEKKCTKCGEIKSLDSFYSKGATRREARCKPCILQAKREVRGILEEDKPKIPMEKSQPETLSKYESEFFSSYEFWDAVVKGFRESVSKERDKAVNEFQNSKMTVEEFNETYYRDDGKLFPSIEDGQMQMKMVIKIDFASKAVRAEKALKLYQDNLSLQEISKTLKRSDKWVRRSLSKFGLRFGPKGVRLVHSAANWNLLA